MSGMTEEEAAAILGLPPFPGTEVLVEACNLIENAQIEWADEEVVSIAKATKALILADGASRKDVVFLAELLLQYVEHTPGTERIQLALHPHADLAENARGVVLVVEN